MSPGLEDLDESQQAGYSPTTPSELRSIKILNYLLDERFVKARLEAVDKTPNIDGTLELTNLRQKQKGKLEVQVKTLQRRDFLNPKYQCEKGFLAYCNNTILPVLLIVVNQDEECAYWLHINKQVLLDAVEKMKGRTVSVSIPTSNRIDRSGTPYLDPWAKIIAELKERIDGYDDMVRSKEEAEDKISILEEKIQRMEGAQYGSVLATENVAFHFSSEIENVRMLRKSGDYTAALRILENERQNNWDSMTTEQRFGLIVQMVATEFGLLNYEKAADLLDGLESYDVASDKKDGLISVRFLIRNDFNNAELFARDAIRKNPDDGNAYLTLLKIRAAVRNRGGEMQLEIPESLKASPAIQWALAREMEETDNVDAAIGIYQSVDWNTEENVVERMDILGSWASSLIQSIRYPELLMQGEGAESDIQKAEKALNLFDDVVGFFKNTQLHSTRYYIYINRAIVNKLLRRADQSASDFQKAYELYPSYISARYLMFNRPKSEINHWLAIAKTMPMTIDNKIELAQVEAELLLSSDRADEALELLLSIQELVDRSGKGDGYFYVLLADILFQLNRIDEVRVILEKLKISMETSFSYVFVSAKYAIMLKDEALLDSFISKLLAVADKMNQIWVRASIFGLLISVRRYKEAADVYRPITNPNVYSVNGRKLIECLKLSKMYHEAVHWIEQFLKIGASDGFLVDALSTIYDECKGRESAIRVVEEYLETHEYPLLQVKLAMLYIAKNDFEKAGKLLKVFPAGVNFNAVLRMHLAQAYVRCDMVQGLDLAYNTLMENESLPAINLAFTDLVNKLCLFRPELNDPQTVGINSFVKLRRQEISMEKVIVAQRQFSDEIGAADELFGLVYGKKVGDNISIEGQDFTIVEIKSKYRTAYDRAKGFPEVDRADEAPFGSSPGDVDADAFRKAYEDAKLMVAERIQIGMPLELLAAQTGTPFIEFRQEFVPEFGIPRVALASSEEYHDFNKQMMAEAFVFDVTACLAIEELDAWEMVGGVTNRKIVPHTVLRAIQDHIGTMHIAKGWGELRYFRMRDNKPTEQVISKEELGIRITKMEALLKKILQIFEVAEGEIPQDYSELTLLRSQLGPGNAEVMRVAKRVGALIISDDPFGRGCLRFSLGMKCGSLASLSIYLFYAGKRSKESHNTFLARLLGQGYVHVPVDGDVIKACVVLDGYQYGNATGNALKEIVMMGTGMFERVLSGISALCMDSLIDRKRKKVLVTAIISAVGGKNWSRDWRTIFSNKLENCQSLQPEDREMLENVVEWFSSDGKGN